MRAGWMLLQWSVVSVPADTRFRLNSMPAYYLPPAAHTRVPGTHTGVPVTVNTAVLRRARTRPYPSQYHSTHPLRTRALTLLPVGLLALW